MGVTWGKAHYLKYKDNEKETRFFQTDHSAFSGDEKAPEAKDKNTPDAHRSQSFNGHRLNRHQSQLFIYWNKFSNWTFWGNSTTDTPHCVQKLQISENLSSLSISRLRANEAES